MEPRPSLNINWSLRLSALRGVECLHLIAFFKERGSVFNSLRIQSLCEISRTDVSGHSPRVPSWKETSHRRWALTLCEQERVDNGREEVVFDHIHATAFQGWPLGHPSYTYSAQRRLPRRWVGPTYLPTTKWAAWVLSAAGGF
jgi:hypothetical protein